MTIIFEELVEGLTLNRLLVTGSYCLVLNFEYINIIFSYVVHCLFLGTATSSTYLQSRCFVTVVWKIFLEECQRKKGLLFVKSKFISTIFNKYLFIVAWVVKCNINVTIFYCL